MFKLFKYKNVNFCECSKDGLTPYEICAAKWHIETLEELVKFIEVKDSENLDKFEANKGNFYSIDVLKRGLIFAIEEGKYVENKDYRLLDLIINQIKFQFDVDTST
jgi:hypothetical protein